MAPSVPTKPLSKLTVPELKALLKERDLDQSVRRERRRDGGCLVGRGGERDGRAL
jgi:hypothetical protein